MVASSNALCLPVWPSQLKQFVHLLPIHDVNATNQIFPFDAILVLQMHDSGSYVWQITRKAKNIPDWPVTHKINILVP